MRGVLASRREDGVDLDVLVYRFDTAMLSVSSASSGGGIGERHWVLNAQVASNYDRHDVHAHVCELAGAFALAGPGVGMLTAANVRRREYASADDVRAEVTVGLSHPTWAASNESNLDTGVGTINTLVVMPTRLSAGALVNAVATATEAKCQALFDAGIPATGTPSDALTVVCPLEGSEESFAGPRSLWGARIARSVHEAVLSGARTWVA